MPELLRASDPCPPIGTIVKDSCGGVWVNDGHYPACWYSMKPDSYEVETWTKIAGNYGPVRVIAEGRADL